MRIWPLYFLFIGICAAAYFLVRVPETFKADWPTLVTYTYNYDRISPDHVTSNFFGHFWTLCIEEQFYLVWPFILYLLPKPKFRILVAGLVIGGPLIRLLTGVVFASFYHDPIRIQIAVHNMTTSHLDAFACGAFLALLSDEERKRFAPYARRIFFCMAALTVVCGLVNSRVLASRGLEPHWQALGYDTMCYLHQYVWSYTLLNLTSASLIFCLIEERFLPGIFQHRIAVYLGTISYGIYVWHLPVLHLLSGLWQVEPHSIPGVARFVSFCGLTILMASLSYFCFERLFLMMKRFTLKEAVRAVLRRG